MMKLLFGNGNDLSPIDGAVATIGNFDGVHLGHQALLQTLIKQAKAVNLPAVVILFEPQPNEFFKPDRAPARLTSLREKLAVIAQYQIDYVCCLRFNETLSQMSPVQFAEQFIFSRLKVKWLLVGSDFRFGKNRAGDSELLKTIGQQRGCQVVVFPDFLLQKQRVSSTSIRHLLMRGELAHAETLLGRPFSLSGRVVKGQGLGRQWGIPTANIRIARIKSPVLGIFCVQVKRADGSLLYGVASLGTRPTVGGTECLLEVNLFDFNDSLYGEMLQVFFVHRLREEIQFSSVNALIQQMRLDIQMTRSFFNIQSMYS